MRGLTHLWGTGMSRAKGLLLFWSQSNALKAVNFVSLILLRREHLHTLLARMCFSIKTVTISPTCKSTTQHWSSKSPSATKRSVLCRKKSTHWSSNFSQPRPLTTRQQPQRTKPPMTSQKSSILQQKWSHKPATTYPVQLSSKLPLHPSLFEFKR